MTLQRRLFDDGETTLPQNSPNYDAAVYCPACGRLGPRDWWYGMDEPPLSMRDDEPEFECIYCGHVEQYHVGLSGGAIEEHKMDEIIAKGFQQKDAGQ